ILPHMVISMASVKKEALRQIISFRSFIFGISLAIIVYLAIAIFSGWEDLMTYLFQVNPLIVLLAMLLSLTNYIFRFLKWHIFTQSLGLDIPLNKNFQVFIAGLSLSITPAKVGEAIRALLLQKLISTDISKGLASTFSERLIDLLAVTILALVGIVVLGSKQSIIYLPILVLILVCILIGVLIFLSDSLYKIISRIFYVNPWRSMGAKVDKFRSDVVVTFNFIPFFAALSLSIIGWACEGLGFFILAQNLGITINFEAAIFIYATSSLLGAISFLPGGLGVVEGSMEIFMADLLAITTALAGALIILIRMTTLWFGVGLGVIFLLLMMRNINNNSLANRYSDKQLMSKMEE
ncbi:MAG: YbhN family protein, partial [Candidatus Hodarchaeota archaeon]